ncbi:glycerol-3-phosphate dehydrogenase/oxidase [Marinoscillum sp. MHG1-6]|uniref:glycerol-3-phosphate dehydrogenase/oxidase n=1 Tax=Marinoscillum sp. MHG1-6 TaxID=2959627 RepID=UPI0021587A58|nr:glycerol-3-phosphate dehydrogenase/oxidase [Marinoscillum sp. MHG1-6]
MNKHRFSVLDRSEVIDEVREKQFDLIIVGGGITGAGIALDAASRGMEVLLLEKNDFASGTSSKSTKLIHGGLRYLKQFEFALVKETGMERAVVHKLAPHLAVPEKMLLPFVTDGTYGSFSTSVGLKVYDFLADVVKKDRRKMLSRFHTLAAEPLLNKTIVEGGGIYSEYRTDDARLTIEVLKTAHRYEATVLNYAEVTAFIEEEKVSGVKFKDHLSSKEYTATAPCVVAAVGPWLDELLQRQDKSVKQKLRLTKGVHIVVPHQKFPLNQAVYFDTPDERMVFAIPRGRVTYIGTTDTEYHGALDRVVTTQKDLEYLLGALDRVFPHINLKKEDVISNWAGLRPLIEEEGKTPSELSRKEEIYEMENGLIAIAGGKLTGYRQMARKVVDEVQQRLDMPHDVQCRTSLIPLTEAPFSDYGVVQKAVRYYEDLVEAEGLDRYYGWHLVSTYGSNAAVIWRKFMDQEEQTEEQLVKSELWYAIEYEMVSSAVDFLVRRTSWMYFDIPRVQQYADMVLQTLTECYNWKPTRVKSERALLDQIVKDATTYYASEKP